MPNTKQENPLQTATAWWKQEGSTPMPLQTREHAFTTTRFNQLPGTLVHQLGWHDTLKGVQGIATASPDAIGIIRMSHKYALARRSM